MIGQIRIGSGIAVLVGSLVLTAGEAAAEWKVYVQGGIGLTGVEVETDGQAGNNPTTPLIGSDHDSSPMLDAAVGLEVPMDELVPREFLLKVRLPDWPVRSEIEAAGLREWELSTVAGSGVNANRFFTELKTTTVLFNQWLDVPLVSVAKPFQYLFGLGRQPRLRQWLEPASLYVGAGIGLTALMDVDGTSNVVGAHDDIVDFAWNVGAGFNFAMTKNVSLSTGYRYVGLPNPSVTTQGPFAPGAGDKVDYDFQVHELRIALRVRVFEFPSPWR